MQLPSASSAKFPPPVTATYGPVLGALQPGGGDPLAVLPDAFVWAEAGKRKTAEDIELDREIARTLIERGSDYSPVQSWTQGLARVAEGLAGGMQMRDANRAAQANAEADAQIAAALSQSIAMTGEGGSATMGNADIAALLANPRVSDSVKKLGQTLLEHNLNSSRPFTVGRDRVQVDPLTGKPVMLFEGREDFEQYADSLGLTRGSDEWNAAAEDFVLRGSGPSAYERDVDLDDHRTANDRSLETFRQQGRTSLESMRQGNRRGMVDYRNANPSPARSRAPKSDIVSVATPSEAMKLPKGTRFRGPDGKVRVRP